MNNSKFENFDRLVIVQNKNQFKEYIKNKRNSKDIILPIGPVSIYLTKLNKIPFLLLKNLIDHKEYIQAKRDSYRKVNRLIYELNVHSKTLDKLNFIEIGNYYAFQLQLIIGQIHYNYFLLNQISKKFKTQKILLFTINNNNKPFLTYRPNFKTLLANVLTRSNLFTSERIQIVKTSDKPDGGLKVLILNKIRNSNLYSYLSFFKIKSKLKNNSKVKSKLLLVTSGYEWLKIQQHILFNKQHQIRLFKPLLKINYKKTNDQILNKIIDRSIKFNKKVIYNLDYLANSMSSDLFYFIRNKDKFSKKIARYNGLIGSVLSLPIENYLAHIGSQKKLSFYLWQHGEKGQSIDPFIYSTELQYTTHYLAYGEGVKQYYEKYINENRLEQVFSVGSLGKKIKHEGGSTILYATGKWFYTGLSFNEGIDPDSRLFECQQIILDFLKALPNANEVVFKANNTNGLNSIPYSMGEVKLEYKTHFTELLKKSKVLILDTPATTFVEASSTTIPIFILGGRVNYIDKVKKLMSKRAVFCETTSELIIKLEAFFKTGLYEADVNDSSYNELYGSGIFESKEIVKNILKVLN